MRRSAIELMSEVPENWIPFIPVHIENDIREIQLRRAALLRVIEGDPAPSPERVEPRTICCATDSIETPRSATTCTKRKCRAPASASRKASSARAGMTGAPSSGSAPARRPAAASSRAVLPLTTSCRSPPAEAHPRGLHFVSVAGQRQGQGDRRVVAGAPAPFSPARSGITSLDRVGVYVRVLSDRQMARLPLWTKTAKSLSRHELALRPRPDTNGQDHGPLLAQFDEGAPHGR